MKKEVDVVNKIVEAPYIEEAKRTFPPTIKSLTIIKGTFTNEDSIVCMNHAAKIQLLIDELKERDKKHG